MRKTSQVVLSGYQHLLSDVLAYVFGKGCRFQPTCSEYSKDAVEMYGSLKGTYLTLKRLSKCHPWGKSGYDPVV